MIGIPVKIHTVDRRGDILTMLEPLEVAWRGRAFSVPAGFECDGVSVPRLFWPLVSPQIDPRSLRAGLAHDYIYRTQPEAWTRGEADLMFLCFLIEDGLAVPRALAAHIGVAVGGWSAWMENKKLLAGGDQ